MNNLIEDYLAGPQKLGDTVAGMPPDQLDAKPVPGKWSTRQVVCHIANCEIVYADRMKRVIVEEHPPMLNLDPDAFTAGLAHDQRDVEEELQLIEAIRRHMGRILRTLESGCFQRTGYHSTDGTLTLETLLTRITNHIPHHIRFIAEKRQSIKMAGPNRNGSDNPSMGGPQYSEVNITEKEGSLTDCETVITQDELLRQESHADKLKRNYGQFVQALTDATRQMKDRHYFAVSVAGRDEDSTKERVYCYELYHQLRMSLDVAFPFKLDGELDKADHPAFTKKMKPDFVVHIPRYHEASMNLVVVEVKPASQFLQLKEDDFTSLDNHNSVYNLGYCVGRAHYYRSILLVYSADQRDLSSGDIREQRELVGNVSRKFDNKVELFWHNGVGGKLVRLISSCVEDD